MRPRILLVNPPIFDFSAYDFWLKPYGLLRVAGFLRGQADFQLFDYLDRLDSRVPPRHYRSDLWGRGEFYSEPAKKPVNFSRIPRRFKRFGLPRATFQEFLSHEQCFDYVLVQTGMTYWYLGIREVIEDIRAMSPKTKIILGGVYTTLCPTHARTLGADVIIEGLDLTPLWRLISLAPNEDQPPFWDLYPNLETGVLKLADGCPFRCTYCSVPQVYPKFCGRPLDRSLRELEFLVSYGARHVAFYDDALLFQPEQILRPFLNQVRRKNIQVSFHTPNALNARFVTPEIAKLMISAGFKQVYLGFESSAYTWQKRTGGKVYSHELARAVEYLVNAGALPEHLHAYIIVGHPQNVEQSVEQSIILAHSLGITVTLSEFSPLPGTPDGEGCRGFIDLDEPLWHNKAAFTLKMLGNSETNRIKNLAAQLNRRLSMASGEVQRFVQPQL